MKASDFSKFLTQYLTHYLPVQRNLSSNTIRSYRDTFKLLLIFCRDEKGFNIYVMGFSSLSIYSLNLFRKGGHRICRMVAASISVGVAAVIVMSTCDSEKRTPTPLGLKFGIAVINRSIRRSYGLSENMVIFVLLVK